MKAKLHVQVRLKSGETERVCWIDNAAVKKGSFVTLKNSEDPKRRWEVLQVSEQGEIPQGDWHVGGL
jgi:hypothetical protein